MFPIKYNAYIIYLELRYERCKISQILLEEKALVKLLKTIDWGKGICYERIVDKVKSVWIRTQIAFKGTEKVTGRTKNC